MSIKVNNRAHGPSNWPAFDQQVCSSLRALVCSFPFCHNYCYKTICVSSSHPFSAPLSRNYSLFSFCLRPSFFTMRVVARVHSNQRTRTSRKHELWGLTRSRGKHPVSAIETHHWGHMAQEERCWLAILFRFDCRRGRKAGEVATTTSGYCIFGRRGAWCQRRGHANK